MNLRLICHSFQNLNNLEREFLWSKRYGIDFDFNLLFGSSSVVHGSNPVFTHPFDQFMEITGGRRLA